MDLGHKVEAPKGMIAREETGVAKSQIVYPTITIEKALEGGYEYGDEFYAQVKVRVKEVSHGEGYMENGPTHRTVLEIYSLKPEKAKGKGLPG